MATTNITNILQQADYYRQIDSPNEFGLIGVSLHPAYLGCESNFGIKGLPNRSLQIVYWQLLICYGGVDGMSLTVPAICLFRLAHFDLPLGSGLDQPSLERRA